MAIDLDNAFQQRRVRLIDFFADRTGDDYTTRVGLFEVSALLFRLRQGHGFDGVVRNDEQRIADLEKCARILDEYLADPHGDMFWMLPMATVQALGRGVLPEATLDVMRSQWKTYTPYRGDTENHWLMYYASLLVMSQLYPGDPGEMWFNGRSSTENEKEATEYLQHWFRVVVRAGQNEFDSPHYLPMYLAPLALLYGYSTSPLLRKEAGAMLDLLIADFASDSLNGLYVGAFSRIYPQPALERARNPSTTFAWLLFGNIEFRPDPLNIILPRTGYRPHAAAVLLAASGYVPDELLHRAATDRTRPYVHRELKRSRNHIRYAKNRYTEVFKYAYVCNEFAMGSIATPPVPSGDETANGTGLVQPIQQHTWELLWATGNAHDKFNMLFALHPNSSPYEMGLYFGEEPRMMTKMVISQEKPTYDAPDKWTGGSPFEQVFQHRNCIVALYDIPEDARYPYVSGFFSKELGELRRHEGWIVAAVEKVFVAYYPLAEFIWKEDSDGNRRLHSSATKNGCIVQCATKLEFGSMDTFCQSLNKPDVHTADTPRVTFQSVEGVEIKCGYGSLPTVDGEIVSYTGWPVFDGPFVRSDRDTGVVVLLGTDGKSKTIKLD